MPSCCCCCFRSSLIFHPRSRTKHSAAPMYMNPVNSCVCKNPCLPEVRSSRPMASPTVFFVLISILRSHLQKKSGGAEKKQKDLHVAGTEQISHMIVKPDCRSSNAKTSAPSGPTTCMPFHLSVSVHAEKMRRETVRNEIPSRKYQRRLLQKRRSRSEQRKCGQKSITTNKASH